MNSAREAAIAAVTNYKSSGQALNFKETPASEVFASNVFHDGVMKDRLPKSIYKALQKTIKTADKLDATVADAVALAMKDWAIEKGATHYAHVFYPLTGITAEKHDSFLSPTGDGHAPGRIRRQGVDPRRARRVQLSVGRDSSHVRGPRLHGLGPRPAPPTFWKTRTARPSASRRPLSLGRARRSTKRRRSCVRCKR